MHTRTRRGGQGKASSLRSGEPTAPRLGREALDDGEAEHREQRDVPTIDREVARLAHRQLGLVTRAQATALGASASSIDRRISSGRWTRLDSGVFVIGGVPLTWPVKVMAACLATGGVASHRSAAALFRLDGFGPGRPEVTVPRSWCYRYAAARVHQSGDFDEFRPVRVDGIPTTPLPRLAVDLGGVVSFERYQAAMLDLIGDRRLTWQQALDSLLAHSKQGRRGCGALRALIEGRLGEEVDGSALERACWRLLERSGLPLPERQVEVFDQLGYIVRVDFAYVRQKIIIELDGRAFHARVAAFDADPERRNRLSSAGWTVLVFTWKRIVHDPTGVIAEIRRSLGAARAG
jgi:very-short-patch-repair endonuclease